jgi:S-methylmethionine-dependent homocysteine/selenocysteine methylase
MAGFPLPQQGVVYMTEGGTETELMYKFGHELPEFAMYPLLDDPAAVADLTRMYDAYFAAVTSAGFVPLVGGLDYRASPDWAARLGISIEGLREYQLRSIAFLRDRAKPSPNALICGVIGPRNDAYEKDQDITASESEDYHSVQLATLVEAKVDLVSALTFNSIPEAIGLARACASVGLPLSMSFMVDGDGCILTGPTFRTAVETIDAETGDARPDFYGINCSHPVEFEPGLDGGDDWLPRVRSLRPNASTTDKIALCSIGHLEAGDPSQLGKHMAALVRRLPNVDIVGGCCGTWDDHLRAIAVELGT